MKTRLMIIGLGLIVGVMLACTWVSLRAEMRALVSEKEKFAQSDRALAAKHASFERQVVEVQGDLAERKRVMLATQSAADRARANVGAFVARLKREHAGRAPIVRPPPPPATTGGGAFFPELMSDPEYNALYARSARLALKSFQGDALRRLGLPDGVVDKAVDLLADEQASSMDLHNLAGSNPLQPTNSKEIQQLRKQLAQETQTQLKALLGDDNYARYKDEIEGPGRQRQYALQPLERRLSYSEEPLSSEQKARLNAYEAAQDYGSRAFFQKQAEIYREARKTGTIPVDEAKLAFYRSVLTPTQMTALEELHREAEASLQRSLLPRAPERK